MKRKYRLLFTAIVLIVVIVAVYSFLIPKPVVTGAVLREPTVSTEAPEHARAIAPQTNEIICPTGTEADFLQACREWSEGEMMPALLDAFLDEERGRVICDALIEKYTAC